MREDRDKWNEKYFKKSFSSEPTDIVKKFYKLAPKGIALDIRPERVRMRFFSLKRASVRRRWIFRMWLSGNLRGAMPICTRYALYGYL